MDVIVVGAGLSGLAAAGRLADNGHAVTVVEAQSRIGGRVHTDYDRGVPVELGAEWFGNAGTLHDLVKQDGAKLVDLDGRYVAREDEKFANPFEGEHRRERLVKRAAALEGPDRSLSEALALLDPPAEHAARLLMYVEGFHAADPSDLSVRWLETVEETQSASESGLRCTEGSQRGVAVLAAGIERRCVMSLESVVTAIRWRPGRVAVDVQYREGRATLDAQALVITVPLTILRALPIDPVPTAHIEAASLLRVAHALRVGWRFREAFWNAIPDLENLAFLFTDAPDFPTFWVGNAAAPVLIAWAGGPRAQRLARLGDDAIGARAFASLAHACGLPAAEVEAQIVSAHFRNWSTDPFARGAYTYIGVGGLDAHKTLSAPLENTLYFAGEATAGDGYNATMEGAVRSGFRAAEQIIGAR